MIGVSRRKLAMEPVSFSHSRDRRHDHGIETAGNLKMLGTIAFTLKNA